MDIDELRKKLYTKEGQANLNDRPEHVEFYEESNLRSQENLAQNWGGKKKKSYSFVAVKRKIIMFVLFGIIFAGLALAAWFLWQTKFSFDKSKILLEVYGQDQIVSGEEISYVVRYRNNTNAILKNAVLKFIYSADSLPFDESNLIEQGGVTATTKNLSDLAPGQEEKIEFKTRVLGDKDSEQKFSARLSYQPSTVSSNFENQAEFTSKVIAVPLVLNFDLPSRAVSGQTLNFSLKYFNTSDSIFSNSQIKIEYPDGFVFTTAQPLPVQDNGWSIAEIGGRQDGKIILRGTLSGNEGENKTFKAQIGSEKDGKFIAFAQTITSIQLSSSPLFVKQTISGMDSTIAEPRAFPGQGLTYQIKYKNTTDVTISPVVVTLKFDGDTVDLSSVDAFSGFFDSNSKIIIWNVSSLPALNSLEPGQEGELTFSFKLKSSMPIKTFSDKNFTVRTTAQIDTPNIPLSLLGTQVKGLDELALKINSRLILDAKGYFNDSVISNSGPLPPRVGQKTTYTVRWNILNESNDLTDVTVEAFLPSYVQWENNFSPSNENLRYDSATGKITWKIGRLSAGTGFTMPVKQIAFQVGLFPSIGQINQVVEIVKAAKITATDTFTGANLETTSKVIKSDMADDPTMTWDKGRVAQ